MKKLLLKLFVKDYQNTKDPIVRSRYGSLAGVFGIITNLIICSLKIIFGILSASVSIIADGINNLSDAGSSIVTLIGFKLSNKPADEDHPFGHERFEYLTGMIISIVILLVGGTLAKDSVLKIISPDEVNISLITIIILVSSILLKFLQALFYKSLAKDIDSTALKATSQDSLNDCISTGAVLVAIIIFKITNFAYIDGIAGLFVAVFIIINGIKLLMETTSPLLGEMPPKEFVEEVVNEIKSYDGVLGIHDLVFHSYGQTKVFITVHIEVDSKVDIMLSHDMVDNIEFDFKKKRNIDLVCHMDPIEIHDSETVELKEVIKAIVKEFDEKLTIHDFRFVKGVTHSNVLFDCVMPIKYELTTDELKNELTKLIKDYRSDLNPVITIDHFYDRNN